jgi:putative hydrolase of the HAD superfamily
MDTKGVKAVLVDFDQVLNPGKLFSEVYSQNFGIDINLILPFIKSMRENVTIGKGDLIERLEEVMDLWKWEGTAEQLLDYWIKSDTALDAELVRLLKLVQTNGVRIYLATNQERHRGKYIWENMGLSKWMDGKFISCDMGFHKAEVNYFEFVDRSLNIEPSKIVLFDDKELFVQNAQKTGIRGVVYNTINDFKNFFGIE